MYYLTVADFREQLLRALVQVERAEMDRKEAEAKRKEAEEERDVLIGSVKRITSINYNLVKDNKRLNEEVKSKDDELCTLEKEVGGMVKTVSEIKKSIESGDEQIKLLFSKVNKVEEKIDDRRKTKKNAVQRVIARFRGKIKNGLGN